MSGFGELPRGISGRTLDALEADAAARAAAPTWWHGYGGTIQDGDYEGVEVRVVLGPTPIGPDDTTLTGQPLQGGMYGRTGLPYLASWDHEPTDEERDAIMPDDPDDADDADDWPAALASITALPAVQQVKLTCRTTPVQLEGTLTDGRHFYFRGRDGRVQLGVGATLDDAVAETVDGGAAIGRHEDAGWLDPDDVPELLAQLLDERTAR